MLARLVDLTMWYFGAVEHAEAMMKQSCRPEVVAGGAADDFVLARFWTPAGIPILAQADLLSLCFTQMIEVQGENGAVMVSLQAGTPQFVFVIDAVDGYSAGRTNLRPEAANLLGVQMAEFVAALRHRRSDWRATLADAMHVVEALEMLKG